MILSTWNFEYALQLQSTITICFRFVRHPMRLLMLFAIPKSIFMSRPFKLINSQDKKSEKSLSFVTVQAFCEEKGLRSLSGVFGYAESKNQCWQAEKWLFIDLICIFSRWPPKTMELVLSR